MPVLLGAAEAAPLCLPASPLQQVLGWLKQRVPQEEQAALAAALRQVVADKLLQQLLLAWLSPDGTNSSSNGGSNGAAKGSKGGVAVNVVALAGGTTAASADAEPMAVDGCGERQQQGAAPPPTVQQQQQQAGGGCDEFVCCRAGAGGVEAHPCGGGKAGGAANGCRYDRDLEEAGITPGGKPPLRVRAGREMGGGVRAGGDGRWGPCCGARLVVRRMAAAAAFQALLRASCGLSSAAAVRPGALLLSSPSAPAPNRPFLPPPGLSAGDLLLPPGHSIRAAQLCS